MINRRRFVLATAAAGLLARPAVAQSPIEISFYYPIAVGGPIPKIIDGLVTDFEKENPRIKVKPIYAGNYQETLVKALTAHRSGSPPVTAVLLSTDMFSLIDEEAIVPFDDLATGEAGRKWTASFFPAFMANSQTAGRDSGGKDSSVRDSSVRDSSVRTWGIPFQRSTVVLYWNKDVFAEAGLDPERAPADWAEHVAFAEKLTRRDPSGNAAQWGTQIPSSGFPYWLFQALTTEAGELLMTPEGDRTFFDKPAVVEALDYWVDLGRRHKVMAPGTIEWGTTPKDFFERKTAMMWTTTGNLTNVKANAKFPFGVAMLPAGRRRGSPTGGGNFYVFRKSSTAEQQAAVAFIQWITAPERAAQWGIDTGYVAVRPDAWETPAMKAYVAGFPAAAVARDQLQYAVAELSTHENQRVTKALNDGLQAALGGSKTPAQALKDAQAEAERILKPYRT